MRRFIFSGLLLTLVILLASKASSDVGSSTTLPNPTAEPTTDTPVASAPGSEAPMKDPFVPFDIGGPDAAVPYSDLSPAEQEVADRGRSTVGWDKIHAGYASAAAELAQRAAATSAGSQLGIDNLPSTGVVP